jgi:hypothetical protein
MQAIDKLKSVLDEWSRKAGPAPDPAAFNALRTTFARWIGAIPPDTIAAVFTAFMEKSSLGIERSGTAALDWLGGVGSLLLMDYDGTPFTQPEWIEIRELLTLDAGDMDIDTLTYILGQVLEHGGIQDA